MRLERIFNPAIPLRVRAIQVTNVAIEWALAGPFDLVHVVEFPKCGGSWIRNMIRTYRGRRLFTGGSLIRPHDVVMAHRLYRRRYAKPIIVVRDPRDVYVSFYYYETAYEGRDRNASVFRHFTHDPDRPVQEDFSDYLQAKLQRPSHPWFYFREFLDAWLDREPSCLVRYEDCLEDPSAELTRMLRFIGEPIDEEQVHRVVEQTSFSAITKERYTQSRAAGQADNTKFHRKGTAGDWKAHFTRDSRSLFEEIEGGSLRRLGYESDSRWLEQ